MGILDAFPHTICLEKLLSSSPVLSSLEDRLFLKKRSTLEAMRYGGKKIEIVTIILGQEPQFHFRVG